MINYTSIFKKDSRPRAVHFFFNAPFNFQEGSMCSFSLTFFLNSSHKCKLLKPPNTNGRMLVNMQMEKSDGGSCKFELTMYERKQVEAIQCVGTEVVMRKLFNPGIL